MNINTAINAHMNWRQRLIAYVDGKGEELDPAIVGRDDHCELGKWIHAEAGARGADAEFVSLRTQHADFHTRAAAVVSASRAGDAAGARRLLEGDYTTIANAVIRALGKLKARQAA